MNTSLLRWIPCVLLMGMLLAGCAEMTGDSQASRREGNRLYNAGSYPEAIGAFQNAIRTDPRDYRAYFGLAASYDASRAYQQAIAHYKATLDVMTRTLDGQENPAFRDQTCNALAACVARSDNRDRELTVLSERATSTQKAEDFLILARAYGYSGDADAALDAYNRANLMAPKDFYVNKAYGLYLVKVGQTSQAAKPLQLAYAADPKDEQVNSALRQIGIVPGLSLRDPKDLSQPLIPKGPLPEPQWGSKKPAGQPAPTPAATPETVQAPRD